MNRAIEQWWQWAERTAMESDDEYDAELTMADEVRELQAALEAAVAENDRLRAALQDALDLAWEDAPAMMVVDVCDRALSVERSPKEEADGTTRSQDQR